MPSTLDVEVTNRSTAKCHFCPRDRSPHQGLLPPDPSPTPDIRKGRRFIPVAAR